MKNNRGSIPFVIIVALVTMMTVLFLTNLLVSEKYVSKKYDKRFESDLYRYQNVIEATKNVTIQKLQTKETKYENKTLYALNQSDLVEINNVLNSRILPKLAQDYSITLEGVTNSKTLEALCEETYEFNPNTGEEEESGVECEATFFYVSYDLTIDGPKGKKKMKLIFNNLYPQESDSGYIQTNTSNLKSELRV